MERTASPTGSYRVVFNRCSPKDAVNQGNRPSDNLAQEEEAAQCHNQATYSP